MPYHRTQTKIYASQNNNDQDKYEKERLEIKTNKKKDWFVQNPFTFMGNIFKQVNDPEPDLELVEAELVDDF